MNRWLPVLVAAACLAWPLASHAQSGGRAGPGTPLPGDTAAPAKAGAFRPLRLAKWGSFAAAAAAGVYGFVENARADDRFGELEQLCEAERTECLRRAADGSYENGEFEALYQSVRRHDRRAHTALIAGQVGVAASLVLFLLDLGNVQPPDDIPWVPGKLAIERARGGLSLGIRLDASF